MKNMHMHQEPQRLQKFLANRGLGSRRQIEEWIRDKRIKVNGEIAELGCLVRPTDQIFLNGRKLRLKQEPFQAEIIIYNKPEGEICSRKDPEGRPTIFDKLPKPKNGKWISVGRLDINSSGLLLLTNDGQVAHQLMHPKHDIEREYAVRIQGDLTAIKQKQLLKGITIDDQHMRFKKITDQGGQGANHWYHVILTEGRYREVRRLFEAVDCRVSRLIRIRFGPIQLPRYLRRGAHEFMQGKMYHWCVEEK